jgi:predicted RNA methylase
MGYSPLEISHTNVTYKYPLWSNILGWVVAGSSSMLIPVIAIYQLAKAKGSLKEV